MGMFEFQAQTFELIGLVLLLYITYLAILVPIYNVTFHPLAKYPGPKIFAAYHFPFFWYTVRGAIPHKIRELHSIYGDAVRIQPDHVSYTASPAWKEIHGYRHDKTQIPKDYGYDAVLSNTHSIVFANDQDHARIRKVLSYAFSDKAMYEQESLITGHVNLLVTKLREKVDTNAANRIDISLWYILTSFDIIGDLAFGQSFGGLEGGIMHEWIKAVLAALDNSAYAQAIFAYPVVHWLFRQLPARYGERMVRHLVDYAEEVSERRLETKTDRKDFMTYILRHNDEKAMTREEIKALGLAIILAGSETSSSLLSGVTYQLLSNPSTYKTLTNEIRTTFRNEEEITFASVSQLPYLQAVLEEGLRIYPSVPSSLPRRTFAPEVINGTAVPPNTRLSITHLAAYHNETNFADAHSFQPERWLTPCPEEFKNDRRDVFQPFAVGPRNCIGRNLAYVEMRLVLVKMLWNLDMELAKDSEGWQEKQTIRSLWEKLPLYVKLTRRAF